LLASFLVAVRVIKRLLMRLEIIWGKCVSSMKKCIFVSLEKCFLTDFCEFFEFIFYCTCALADQSLYAGIVYKHYCLCPGWPCARKRFKKVVYVHDVPWMLGCETGYVCNLYIPLSSRPPTIRPIIPPRFEHLKISPLYRRVPPCEFHIELHIQCIRWHNRSLDRESNPRPLAYGNNANH
jgi:hypothetical protein